MANVNASLQVNFASWAAGTPLEVEVDDTEGDKKPASVHFNSWVTITQLVNGQVSQVRWNIGFHMDDRSLLLLAPGQQRIKIYCSKADASNIKIQVDNGARQISWIDRRHRFDTWKDINGYMRYKDEFYDYVVTMLVNNAYFVSRVSSPIIESLNWSGNVRQRLKYFYDQPSVKIVQQTVFRDKTGAEIPAPVYDQEKGEFFTTDEAVGALVVEYSPEYSVYNILFDNAETIASADLFSRMKNLWMVGGLNQSDIVPPVRLIVLTDNKSAITSFKRVIWPEVILNQSGVTSVSTDWNDINLARYNATAKAGTSKPVEDVAEEQGVEQSSDESETTDNLSMSLVEKPGTRQTVTKRVTSENDPDQYIDFNQITYFEATDTRTGEIFKIRMLNE